MDVSIIIVNYNTKKLLSDCLESIMENTTGLCYEVIVSDNGSQDGSVEMLKNNFKEVILIENNENLGFGAANNRALSVANGKYIFYLNSDTVLMNNAVKMFYDYWENNESIKNKGCLGAQLLNEDMKPTHSWANYPTPLGTLKTLLHMCLLPNTNFRKNQCFEDIPRDGLVIDGYVTGAALFLKNDENAFFDEQFFMYAEETDLEYNHFYKKGKKSVIIPGPQIIHLEGGSDNSSIMSEYDFGKKSVIFLWISNLKYLRKNFPKSTFLIAMIKAILVFVWNRKKYKNRTYKFKNELMSI